MDNNTNKNLEKLKKDLEDFLKKENTEILTHPSKKSERETFKDISKKIHDICKKRGEK